MKISRRDFARITGIGAAFGLVGAPATRAIEPFQRAGQPRLRLSLAAYSLRDYFKDSDSRRTQPIPAGKELDMLQFVDYCADHGCQGAEITSYYFPGDFGKE